MLKSILRCSTLIVAISSFNTQAVECDNTIEDKKTHYVLSLDGGGSIIPQLTVLHEIERSTGKPVNQIFDLVVSTGTGTAPSHALTTASTTGQPISAGEMLTDFLTNGKELFQKNSLFTSFLYKATTTHKTEPMHNGLKKLFGAAKLSDSKTNVVTLGYDLAEGQSVMFKSWEAKQNINSDYLLSDLVMGETAEPGKFPAQKVSSFSDSNHSVKNHTLISSVRYTDPSQIAFSLAKDLYGSSANIVFVSLGAGEVYSPVSIKKAASMNASEWKHYSAAFSKKDNIQDDLLNKEMKRHNGDVVKYRFNPLFNEDYTTPEDLTAEAIENITFSTNKMLSEKSRELSTLINSIKN